MNKAGAYKWIKYASKFLAYLRFAEYVCIQDPEPYKIGDVVHIRTVRGLDPSPHTIHKVLDDGQYVLSRSAAFNRVIYSQESSEQPKTIVRDHDIVRPRPKAKSGRTAQEKIKTEIQTPTPVKVDKPMEVEMKELPPNVNVSTLAIDGERTENAGGKLHLGETEVRDFALEQAQNVAVATKLDDGKAFPPIFSLERTLEEVSTENDQLIRQNCLKEPRLWNVRTMLSMFGLGERPLQKGKTRVRWRCACGRNMYDDFAELRSGAAAELEKWLNTSIRKHLSPGSSDPTQSNILGSTASPRRVNAGHQHTAGSDISLQRRIDSIERLGGRNAAITLDDHLEKCWLLVCGKSKRGLDSLLTHMDLFHTPSDKALFTEMREFYSNLRNSWGLLPFLRGVKTIRFVQVSIFHGRPEKISRSRAD